MTDTPKRSVLFLIADDWSPLAGCYGSPVIQTPNIDRFAERGVAFDHAFCISPSCAASRACVLTGLYTHTHGQYGHTHSPHGFRTHEWVRSTPGILREHGFLTGLVGKGHVAPDSVYPFEQRYVQGVNNRDPQDMAAAIRRFLDEAGGRPFYLHCGYADPHRAGPAFGNDRPHGSLPDIRYRPEDVPVPDFLPDIPEVRTELAEYYQAISRYDQGIGAALQALEESGRADDTMVIVTSDHGLPFPGAKASSFDSGHHCPFLIATPEMTRRGHHNRAMINWANIAPTILDWCGVLTPADLLPADIPPAGRPPVGVSTQNDRPPAPSLPERSLLPILEETDPPGWDEVYFSHCFHEVTNYYPYRAVRGRQYKLVRHFAHQLPTPLPSDLFRSLTWQAVREREIAMLGKRPTQHFLHREPEELYDIQADPTESHNLIQDPRYAGVAAELRRKLMDFRIHTRDPWLQQSIQEGEEGAEVRRAPQP